MNNDLVPVCKVAWAEVYWPTYCCDDCEDLDQRMEDEDD